ncbi:MAG: hypothetical protein HN348_00320 [Proteobacteria bacterium]|nr:hypothetical protein [Pseudomonadota bacterium]
MTCRVDFPLAFCLLVNIAGCSSPVDDARKLAVNGDTEAALRDLEHLVHQEPGNAPAWETIGDVRMLSLDVGVKDTETRLEWRTNLFAADEAYARAANVVEPTGLAWSKHAFVKRLLGDQDGANERARRAWECCQETSALYAIEDEEMTAKILAAGSWSPGEFNNAGIPPTQTRKSFLVKPSGGNAQGPDDESPVSIPEFSQFEGEWRNDGVHFADIFNTRRVPGTGYVDYRSCEKRGSNRCLQGRWTKKDRWRSYDIMTGPCWQLCTVGTFARKMSTTDLDYRSIQCVPGTYSYKGVGSCKVSFERVRKPSRVIPQEEVWALPDKNAARRIEAAHKAGLMEIRDHIAEGGVAIGLPITLVSIGDVENMKLAPSRDAFEITFETNNGPMRFVDGILVEWGAGDGEIQPPKLDKGAGR